VTTEEQRLRTRESGKSEPRSLIRRTVVRRNPDRFYFQTSGDVDNQGWYDGVGIALVINNENVFAQARMPETLDRALDAISERYGIALPVGDLLHSSPIRSLIASTTTGGWIGQEDLPGNATIM
jgi:hypothetical protein